jgi:hypothetical protein
VTTAIEDSVLFEGPIYRVGLSDGKARRFEDCEVVFLARESPFSNERRSFEVRYQKWGGRSLSSPLGSEGSVLIEPNAVSAARETPQISGGKDQSKKAKKA